MAEENLNLYEYAVIRYVPRVEREEFINIGLIMMCKRRRWLRVRIEIDSEKTRIFNAPHSDEFIRTQCDTFINVGNGVPEGGPISTLPAEERFRWLTAVKSSCLSTSRPHPGKCLDLDATFDSLFSELVG